MYLPSNIICLDLETTSIDKVKGSIVQLSAVAMNEKFEFIHAREFNSLVKPLDSFRDPSAMKIHGYSENELKIAPTLEEILIMFESFCDNDKILAAWGNYFDIEFLKEQYKKIRRNYPFMQRSMDLKSIAIWEMAKKDIPISGSIKKFLRALDTEFKGISHNAIDDIKNSIEILRILKDQK